MRLVKIKYMLDIINRYKIPTPEAIALRDALKARGILIYLELNDGYKHIDLAIPKAKIDIEVDGIQHLINPKQILADLSRGYYSYKNGYDTIHIPNEMINNHLDLIADALAKASKIREKRIYIHLDQKAELVK